LKTLKHTIDKRIPTCQVASARFYTLRPIPHTLIYGAAYNAQTKRLASRMLAVSSMSFQLASVGLDRLETEKADPSAQVGLHSVGSGSY